MKKILLLLFMAALCIFFFLTINERRPYLKKDAENINVLAELQKDNEKIDESYPNSSKDVIESHNKLMSYLYSRKMEDQYVELYVDTIRKLYSDQILELNTKEEQIQSILAEKEENTIKMIKLLGSEIQETIYLEGGTKSQVKVEYYINMGDIIRLYNLEKTPDGWKITGWKDSKVTEEELEE